MPLAPQVMAKIKRVRQLLRRYVAIQTLCLVVLWCLLVFWVGAMVDYLPVRFGASETPKAARAVMLAVMGGGAMWLLVRWAGPRLWRRLPDRSVALLIEKHYPSLENELITAVELAHDDDPERVARRVSNPQVYLAMLQRVRADVARRMEVVDPAELFNWQPLWTVAVGTIFAILFSGVAAASNPRWVQLWAQRLFVLSDMPWPRRAQLRHEGVRIQLPAFTGQLTADRVTLPVVDHRVRVPRGTSAELRVGAKVEGKIVPEVCTVYYRADDGVRGRANMRRVGRPQSGWQSFVLDGPPLDNITASMSIDVVGLDARLRNLRLEAVDPAVVVDVRVRVTYPEYLLKSMERSPVETLPYRAGMQVPEGAAVALLGKANGPLQNVQYVVRNADQDLSSGVIEIQQVEPQEQDFAIDLGELKTSSVVELRLIDADGLSAEPIPRYVLPVQEDQTPQVDTHLVGIGTAVTPVATIPIRGSITDDHGIEEVLIEITTEDHVVAIPVNQPLKADRLAVDLDLEQIAESGQLELQPGDAISLLVTARDYYDLNGKQHVGRGLPKQLAVVTADQLLTLLDRQELQLRERLDQIITELTQLREVLQRIASTEQSAFQDGRRAAPTRQVGRIASQRRPPSNWSLVAMTMQDDDQLGADEVQRRQQMILVRAQQSLLQADKSYQELRGVAAGIDNVRLQLINNRIDSVDRQKRLLDGVYRPLTELLDEEFEDLKRSLAELQTAAMSGDAASQAVEALRRLDIVLAGLQRIREKMLDIESFNEIIDLVRDLLQEQEELMEETEKAQRASILDILK